MWMAGLLVAGLLTGLVSSPVLRALPEPTVGDLDAKRPYASIATRPFALGVTLASLTAAGVIAVRLPMLAGLVWLPLATVGVLLACIDAVTTWLPLLLTRILWASTLGAAAMQVVLATNRTSLAIRMVIGAAAVGLFFWGFWWLVGGLGFGDVRLAPVLGTTLASVSWTALLWGLLLGTSLGAVIGVIRHIRGRSGPFAYGPALVTGTFLALLLV